MKNELKILAPKVTNDDGFSALNSIISSIQATQDHVSERERKSFYEDPYKKNLSLKMKTMALDPKRARPKRAHNVSVREALSRLIER